MFAKKSVRDIDVKGKKVLVRVDFNVPIKEGVVQDDTRIRAAMPTIQYLLDQGAAVILFSHLGRPKGGPDPKYSMKPVADYLAGLTGKPVAFAADCVGEPAEQASAALQPGGILVLENTRFHPEEEKNDLDLAKKMAALAEVYVNDAFGSAHRAHSSTEGVARFLPAIPLLQHGGNLRQPGHFHRRPHIQNHDGVGIGGGHAADEFILAANQGHVRAVEAFAFPFAG